MAPSATGSRASLSRRATLGRSTGSWPGIRERRCLSSFRCGPDSSRENCDFEDQKETHAMSTRTTEVKEKVIPPAALATDSSLSAYGKARSTVQGTPLSAEVLRKT